MHIITLDAKKARRESEGEESAPSTKVPPAKKAAPYTKAPAASTAAPSTKPPPAQIAARPTQEDKGKAKGMDSRHSLSVG
jgi:hypothetical protein